MREDFKFLVLLWYEFLKKLSPKSPSTSELQRIYKTTKKRLNYKDEVRNKRRGEGENVKERGDGGK